MSQNVTVYGQSRSVTVIPEVQNEIIEGNVYNAFLMFELESAAKKYIGMVTPSDTDTLLSTALLASDINYVSLKLYENATFTGDGAAPYINANRKSTNTGSLVAYQTFDGTPSIVGATEIEVQATIGNTVTPVRSSGSTQVGREFIILKRNTKYLFVFENEGSGTAIVLAKEAWMERDLEG